MKVIVAIPWRPQSERMSAFEFTKGWVSNYGDEVITVDTDHTPYNLSAVRNKCVREAEALGADVVIINDADVVIAPPWHVADAVQGAYDDGKAHLPFTMQRYMSAEETAAVIASPSTAEDYPGVGVGNGCCYVIRPDSYWLMGGSETRLFGWGADDDCFVAAARTLIGLIRHEGVALSLHHADERRPVGTEEHRPNAEMAHRYWNAVDDKQAMLKIIAERGDGRDS